MANTAAQIAEIIRARMKAICAPLPERVAVALSGGVDSGAVLAAMMEVNVETIVVSYTPSTHESTDFQMARDTARNLNLEFYTAEVQMDPAVLEDYARAVVSTGYKAKVQVESLTPMIRISEVAKEAGASILLTGDQSDGYFCLSKWAAHNYDRSQGVPYRQRSRHVHDDTDPGRIDAIRRRYYLEDFSCSEGVRSVCALAGLPAGFPFRDYEIARSFKGTLWGEVNRPRIKEPIRLAFADYFTEKGILVRPTQVNLHKGDSYFGDRFSEAMMERFPGYKTPRGLYSAMARGEV